MNAAFAAVSGHAQTRTLETCMTSSSRQNRQAHAAGLPHVAYVLLWYPLFTQPFIFREVQGLREHLPLSVFSLYSHNLRHCSTEMRDAAGQTHTFGIRSLPRLLAEIGRQMFFHPLRTSRLFFRTMGHRWNSLETLGENLWAFCVGVYLGRLFVEAGIDMVYAPWPRGTASAAWVAASLAGLPFATSARGDNLDPADPDLGDKFRAALFLRANNAADKKRIEEFDQGQARGKVELVYNCLTLPLPAPAPEKTCGTQAPGGQQPMQRPVRLLALGRFDVTKGFDVLVRACGLLRDRGMDFRLTLAGGGGAAMGLGHMDRQILRLRKDLGLEEHIFLPGLVNHNDLPRMLAEHDIFVAPCVMHSSGRRDGIPNTVIEAMSCGLPVVSTTVNALPEVVRNGQTGLGVPPNDPAALADALQCLADDAGMAARLASNGRDLARTMFDSERNSLETARIFIHHFSLWKRTCAA